MATKFEKKQAITPLV